MIIKGSVGKDHIHVLLSCPPTLSPAKIMQYLRGRSLRLLQVKFSELKRKYWGRHLWSMGYFCATVGSVTEEMIKAYIENQGGQENQDFKIER